MIIKFLLNTVYLIIFICTVAALVAIALMSFLFHLVPRMNTRDTWFLNKWLLNKINDTLNDGTNL